MGGRTLSDAAKKRIRLTAHHARIQKAADAYRAERARPLLPDGRRQGSRVFAGVEHVNHTTVVRRAAGARSILEFNESKQHLTPAQELQLVEFAENCADRGFPLKEKLLEDFALALLSATKPELTSLGHNWAGRFIERHRDRLQSHLSRSLDRLRANGANPEAINHWFTDIVYKQLIEAGIEPRLLFGMDESGFTLGVDSSEVVIGRRGAKMTYQQGAANREMVSVLVTICADGSWLPPLLVYKGKKFQKAWRRGNTANCSFAISDSGWTDSEIALGYLDAFDAQTLEKANGLLRGLLVDNQTSHVAPAFLRLAIERNIRVVSYPPHTTHVAQGLDVGCFAALKRRWAVEVREFERLHGPMRKADFCEVFCRTITATFTPELVLNAWEKTGIHPFNPKAITPDKLAPSAANSVRGTFPQPQPTPIRAIMAAFSTAHTTVPAPSVTAPSVVSEPDGIGIPIDPVLCTPSTPTRRPLLDIDPTLVTPLKQIGSLRTGLADTAVSFLVAPAKVTSAQVLETLQRPVLQTPPLLEQPEWALLEGPSTTSMNRTELQHYADALAKSLALSRKHLLHRDKINESYAAQLLLQNVYLGRSTEALYGKENREPIARSFFPKGHGRVLTDSQFVELLEAEGAGKEAEEAEKAKRSSRREQRKAQKLANEQLWQEMRQRHQQDVEEWQREYNEARRAGVRAKDIRKRPARPKRSDLPPLPAIDSDEDAFEEEEEDED